MREKGAWSEATYTSRAKEATTRGSATYEGEQRARQGKGLDPLVDPKKFDVIRVSNNLMVPEGDGFSLKFGVAMPVETDIDTTGSMGGNVEIAFRVQPKVQNLLIQGKSAVLKRYHAQIATGVVQDRQDRFPYQRSQFEPDNEVEKQMGLLVPEKDGGDSIEDYQLGLFAAAYLSKTSITNYGLRGYYFSVGDERGRDTFDPEVLERVFGPTVMEKAFGKTKTTLPSVKEAVAEALSKWHVFFLQVGDKSDVTSWWKGLIGKERIVRLPKTEDLAEVQACIIGLTEGVLNARSAVDFLREANVSASEAQRIVDACLGIPLGLQKTLPNFDKIPMAGAKFTNRDDIWPGTKAGKSKKAAPVADDTAPAKKGKKTWKL